MANKNTNESIDTMKFSVPKADRNIEKTQVYRIPKKNSEVKNTAGKTDAIKQAVALKTSAPSSQNNKPKQPSPIIPEPIIPETPPKPVTPKTAPEPTIPPPTQKNRSASQTTNQTKTSAPKAKNKKKEKSPFLKFLKISAIVIVALFLIYSGAALYYASCLTPIEKTNQYINDDSTMLYSSEVKNILIIGADARDSATRGLSDSMILLSVNKKNKKLQMTSFMRDMYVEIEGYGSDKLNAAYSYGGAELLENTIEDNFKIRIDSCVTVNFIAVAHIVDSVGGVEITLSDSEAQAVNDILYSEVNGIMGDDPYSDFLSGGGTHKLNGKQALSYSRIRYVGDADFERTQRQRTVITQLFANMKSINPFTFHKNITKALPYISTDLDLDDMYVYCLRLPSLLIGYDTEQMRVPAENTWWYDQTWDGQSIIGVDFNANIEYLKNNIYLVG